MRVQVPGSLAPAELVARPFPFPHALLDYSVGTAFCPVTIRIPAWADAIPPKSPNGSRLRAPQEAMNLGLR